MIRTATKETIKKKTIGDMKKLDTHKPEYNRIIDIYSELVSQYQILTKEFEESGYQCEVETGQGGSKKSPIVATLETLRKDILAYSDRLCLNPKSMDAMNIKPAPPKSKLDMAMEAFRNG